MANAINPLTIATNIAALAPSVTINGTPTTVQIYDLTDFPEAPDDIYCPMVFPLINFVTGFEPVRDALATGTVTPWSCTYYLNYRVLYTPVTVNRTIADVMAPMIDLWAQLATILIQSDVAIGAEAVEPREPFNMDVVNAPNETPFFGFDMRIMVMEFLS